MFPPDTTKSPLKVGLETEGAAINDKFPDPSTDKTCPFDPAVPGNVSSTFPDKAEGALRLT